jgi:hypothetical protein
MTILPFMLPWYYILNMNASFIATEMFFTIKYCSNNVHRRFKARDVAISVYAYRDVAVFCFMGLRYNKFVSVGERRQIIFHYLASKL